MEEWKDIKGYEGFYQVSNIGRVRSLDRYITRSDGVVQFKKGIIKQPKENSDGYYTITLNKNGKNKTIGIHRLVAQAFIPNPDELLEVNHIDYDRKNNNVNNLEWCTHQDNIKHSAVNYKKRNFYGKNNPNYKNTTLKEYYCKNPDAAKKLLSRPADQNGKAKSISMFDKDWNLISTFSWIGGCAEFLKTHNYTNSSINAIRDRIGVAVKNNKTYLGFYYKKD